MKLHTNYTNPKKFKIVLISIILLTLGAMVAVFVGYRRILNQEPLLAPVLQAKANIALGKVNQVATRNGVTEWRLEASSARVVQEKRQAVFQDPVVTFYLKDNTQARLSAAKGIVNTDSNDIEVSGGVVVQKESYRLETERLLYRHRNRVLFSEVPVKIVGLSSTLSGNAVTYDLNTGKTELKGSVKGVFSEKFNL